MMKHFIRLFGLGFLMILSGTVFGKENRWIDQCPKEAVLSYIPSEVTKLMIIAGNKRKGTRQVVKDFIELLESEPRFKTLEDGKQLGDISRLNDEEIAAKARDLDIHHVLILRTFGESETSESSTLVATSLLVGGQVWGGFSLTPQETLKSREDVKSAGEGLSNEAMYSIYGRDQQGSLNPDERKEAESKYRRNYLQIRSDDSGTKAERFAVFQGTSTEALDPIEFYELVDDETGIKAAEKQGSSYRETIKWGKIATFTGVGLVVLSSTLAGEKLSDNCDAKVDTEACQTHQDSENRAVSKAQTNNVLGGLVIGGIGGYLWFGRAPTLQQNYYSQMYAEKKKIKAIVDSYNKKLLKKLKLNTEPAGLRKITTNFSDTDFDKLEPLEQQNWSMFLNQNAQRWLVGFNFYL